MGTKVDFSKEAVKRYAKDFADLSLAILVAVMILTLGLFNLFVQNFVLGIFQISNAVWIFLWIGTSYELRKRDIVMKETLVSWTKDRKYIEEMEQIIAKEQKNLEEKFKEVELKMGQIKNDIQSNIALAAKRKQGIHKGKVD